MPENCNPSSCPVSAHVDALEKEFDRYRGNSSETHKEIFSRIRSLEDSRATLDERFDGLETKLDGVAEAVNAISSKPGKRWEWFSDKTLWFLLEAVLLFLAVKFGLR